MSNRNKSKQLKSQLCAYCGAPATTKDHVIPQALFPTPKPPDSEMLIVPACRQCNQELAKHQDYLRDWLVVDYRSSDHPVAKQLFETTFLRAAQTNRSTLARSALATSDILVPVFNISKGGLGYYSSIPFEHQRVEHVLSMMGRGLYYSLRQMPLPDHCIAKVVHLDPNKIESAWSFFSELGAKQFIEIGRGDVCHYVCVDSRDDLTLTAWLLLFYDSVPIIIVTLPASDAHRLPHISKLYH